LTQIFFNGVKDIFKNESRDNIVAGIVFPVRAKDTSWARSAGPLHEWEKSGGKSQSTDKSFFYFAARAIFTTTAAYFCGLTCLGGNAKGGLYTQIEATFDL